MSGYQGNKVQVPTSLRAHLIKLNSIASIAPYADLKASEFKQAFIVKEENPVPGHPEQAVSSVKQLSLGMLMYTSDYDDITPFAQSTTAVQYVTYPYIKSLDLWSTGNPNNSRFLYNTSIGGVAMSDIPEPMNTVMFYESAPWPDGRRVVAFVDGHARVLTDAEWRSYSPTLQLKLKKSAKPLPGNYGVKEMAAIRSGRNHSP
jgi:prepilin-type processing-associated H-X9-DG protein